ncbi:MAG: M48 family metalloprotease [Terracidiphilus sp.]
MLFPIAFWGQQAPGGARCSLPTPPFVLNRPNIFNDQQEQWLGDAQANQQEPGYDLLPEKDSEELTRIGQKLLAQLPPTPIHYHFRIYESGVADAFSLASGYVYLSRKLITDARSEDEIAGVLAHEIGHIYTHQVAIAYSRLFKARMNLTSLGSQEDINDKLQQLLNVHMKQNENLSDKQLDDDELLADRVGMYAMVRAGYAPRTFAECLDRITANKGHVGNFLLDMLDIDSIINRRVRAARSLANELSGECKNMAPGMSPEFKEFQQKIRSAPVKWLIDPTPGLQSFKMDPPMRSALDQVRFSPNGQYVLAQDETKIHVLSRPPLKLLFSIVAPGAEDAHFTPDSMQVVFHYQTMRVERWNVASGKRENYFELVDYEGCPQTSLSPDGKTFVCLSTTKGGVWLKLMDVDTGKLFYDNKNFYEALFGVHPWAAIVRYVAAPEVATVAYSQDGRTMIVAAGIKSMAYDLVEHKPISMRNDLSGIVQGRMAFVDSDKLVFSCDTDTKKFNISDTFKMCETTFPDGSPIHDFRLGYQWMDSVAHGNHVLIGPVRDSTSVLVDPSTGKASAAFKLEALDLYDQTIASETASGGVTVGELGSQKMDAVDLPMSPMPELAAAEFSPDGRYLAFSNRSRSSIWDLNAQKQVALMRPFRAVRFDDQDQMFAQYQESHLKPGQNSHIDLKTGKTTEEAKYDALQRQFGNVLVSTRPMDKFEYYTENTEMDVFDLTTGAQLWSKRFPHETPILRNTDGDALLLISDLRWQTATDETAHTGSKFIKATDKKGEWLPQGLLVEVLDSRTGDVRRQIALPEPQVQTRYSGQYHDRRSASLYGNYLVVHGNYNNSVIYRVSDGERTGAFFGRAIAGDEKLGLIAATNRDQDVIIYDATTGKEVKRVIVDHVPRAVRFIADKKVLLVLTATQRVYTIDLPATGQATRIETSTAIKTADPKAN